MTRKEKVEKAIEYAMQLPPDELERIMQEAMLIDSEIPRQVG